MSNKLEELKTSLFLAEKDFQDILGEDIEASKFLYVALNFIQNAPDLLDKNRQSLFHSLKLAASDKLFIDGREAALTYYKEVVKYTPMVAGLIKKLIEAGVSINPQIVYEKDSFRYWTDEKGQHILHEPNVFSDRGKGIGAYSIATTKEGNINIEIMSKEDIEKVKSKSKQQDSLMWTTFWTEGWKKTVIRRAYKWLPKNENLNDFIKKDDDENFDFNNQSNSETPKRTTSRIEEIVNTVESTPKYSEDSFSVPPVSAPKTDIPANEVIEGVITGIKVEIDQEDSKKRNRFKCQVDGQIYSSYDEKMYREQIEPYYNEKLLVRVSFSIDNENFKDTRRFITMIERVTAEEHFNKPEAPATKPKKDLPL